MSVIVPISFQDVGTRLADKDSLSTGMRHVRPLVAKTLRVLVTSADMILRKNNKVSELFLKKVWYSDMTGSKIGRKLRKSGSALPLPVAVAKQRNYSPFEASGSDPFASETQPKPEIVAAQSRYF